MLFLLTLNACQVLKKNGVSKSQLAAYEKEIKRLQQKFPMPGLSVGIAANDAVVYAKGFGFADIENQTPVTENTPFRIASLTKTVASMVLMSLVESGQMDINWKVKDYYPDYLGTCERILGYFNDEIPEYSFLLNQYEPKRDDILIKHHLSHTAEKTPGDKYKYNGFLFGMLSNVMETATKTKFDTLVNRMVIDKLQLTHSASSQIDKAKPNVIKWLAKPYIVVENGQFKLGEYPNPKLNAGAGMVSSVTDLLVFDKAINQNVLIKKETKKKQFTPYKLNDGSVSPYGLGWFTQKYKGYTLVWHYGWQPKAYSGLYLKVLEKNLTLVLLANSEELSSSFDLGKGDVLNSEFAKSFLLIFLK